jgi:hypothetical protein
MTFSKLHRVFFTLLLSFTSSVFSLTFNNPYLGNIIADEKSEKDLQALALKQVLIKVSGNANIASLPEAQKLLKNPSRLLSQFNYENYHGLEYYVVLFQDRKINNALKKMNQPIWGVTRPKTLVWIVEESLSRYKKILSDTDLMNEQNWALANQPHQRGITLQFPLMDLEDRMELSPTDIKGRFYSEITKASARYHAQRFAVAYMQEKDSKWHLSLKLVKPDPTSKKNVELISAEYTGSKVAVQIKMVNALADYYAGLYAIKTGKGEKFVQPIYVHNVSSFDKFAQLARVLDQLNAVSSFYITKVDESTVQINVKVNGGLNSFKNAFSANWHITYIATPKEPV